MSVAARPSYTLEDIDVAVPGETELLHLPHFLLQGAIQIGLDL